MKNKLALYINVFVSITIVSVGVALAAWTAPSDNPPDANADSPITVGGPQIKKGGLLLNTDGYDTGLDIDGGDLFLRDLPNCDTVDTDSNGKFVCGADRDTDQQQLGTSGDQITLERSSSITAPHAIKAANLAGGAVGQIPFQTAANTTGFNNFLTWDDSTQTIKASNASISGQLSASGYVSINGGGLVLVNSLSSIGIGGGYGTSASAVFQGNDPIPTTLLATTDGYLIESLRTGEGKISSAQYCIDRGNCINNWTHLNTANAVVKRDSLGNIAVNKITANTFDPVYIINGKQYATYLPAMTGVKEETAGLIKLSSKVDGIYEYSVDFKTLEEGSDLWLFGKATNIKNHFNDLIVSLTPSFNGDVWYEKNLDASVITFFAETNVLLPEISYRLTAPRFDSADWSNYNYDLDVGGLIIND